jgi:hypothetical protein
MKMLGLGFLSEITEANFKSYLTNHRTILAQSNCLRYLGILTYINTVPTLLK